MSYEYKSLATGWKSSGRVHTGNLCSRYILLYLNIHQDSLIFFFQAEDGIRDDLVTGVQTCALPIFHGRQTTTDGPTTSTPRLPPGGSRDLHARGGRRRSDGGGRRQDSGPEASDRRQIGRASCRERG